MLKALFLLEILKTYVMRETEQADALDENSGMAPEPDPEPDPDPEPGPGPDPEP